MKLVNEQDWKTPPNWLKPFIKKFGTKVGAFSQGGELWHWLGRNWKLI